MGTNLNASQLLSFGADAVHLSKRPPPDAPTGYYDWQITPDTADDVQGHSKVTNLLTRAEGFIAKGGFKPTPTQLSAVWDSLVNPQSIDDRKGGLSTGLEILAKIDPESDLAVKMGNGVINLLYNTVPHPPASYLGPQHMFRNADGSGNNLENPDLGRSGTTYARSVQGKYGLPRSSLPDPGLVFDTILKRNRQKQHPGGMSSLIFAYASIVTHSLFRTDLKNIAINNASSYLDLSPLYGDNQAAQDKIRDKAQGRGLLYPDTFSEDRLLFLPPAASVLLVMYSRNHNYIAEKILKINERKRWTDPPPTDPALRALQDEEIFQTARLVNGGHFINSITGDYAAGFMGSAEGCNWNMKPFDRISTKDLTVPRGQGNHCSVEFNVLYRWHPTISTKDEKWTEDLFARVFNGKPSDQLTMQDLGQIGAVLGSVPENPAIREFSFLKRGPDGKFSDDDLFSVLADATESPACSYGGLGSPGVLRLVEIMGLEQARSWGVCTMNEFREYLGLKKFENFEEWNPDTQIANAARRLYGHIDNLELYTGIVAEEIMPLTDGLRFSCGYTTTRAVLGDAIALVRGDRFYTSDFTPGNLTTWGFYDCQREMTNGGGGSMIPKLLLRHLPNHYPWNSVYSLWPFFTPQKMTEALKKQGIANKYTFERPTRKPTAHVLTTFTAIDTVFADPTRFPVAYPRVGYGSLLNLDNPAQHDADRMDVLRAIFPDKATLTKFATWMAAITKSRIQEKSFRFPGSVNTGTYLDIVKDVINPVGVQWVCDKMMGISPKTKENPSGLYTYNELYDILSTLFTGNILNIDDPQHAFSINEASANGGAILGALTAKSIIEVSPASSPNFVGGLAARAASFVWPPADKPSYPFLSKLTENGRPIDQCVGLILGLAVGSSVNFAQAAVHVVDFYLDDERAKERAQIIKLVNMNDQKSNELLRGYVCEALRLRPQFPGLWRKATADAQIPQGPGLPPVYIKAGEMIWGSFRRAHLNPADFPDPTTVNPSRPLNSYHLNGAGFHNCIGTAFTYTVIGEMMKVIFKLRNIRRAPGDAGQLKRIVESINETDTDFFVQRNGTISRWPGPMQIVYDA
ncbi:heme peroxidase [Pholiota conissans]|uniref:Heme peroxidase n=1 Tax=Pholiota conissans TaxID=109636 RepID=A0A9P5YZC4_9AGAR|nr:heme peroxidase [Pholiota conissans]